MTAATSGGDGSGAAQAAALIELLAIVDIDARPLLAVLSLAQAHLPAALEVCNGQVLPAVFRFRDACAAQLRHCQVQASTRDASVRALHAQGVPEALATAFLGTHVASATHTLMRLDAPQWIALVHPASARALLMQPDHVLISDALDDAQRWMRELPSTPRVQPDWLEVSDAQSIAPALDASALRTLRWSGPLPLSPGLATLGALPALRSLGLSATQLADADVLEQLPLAALQTLCVSGVGNGSAVLGECLRRCSSLRRLRLHGMYPGALALLPQISARAGLTHVDLQISDLKDTAANPHWVNFWPDLPALRDLRLAFISCADLVPVLAPGAALLERLLIAGQDLAADAARLLQQSKLPSLRELDLAHAGVDGPLLQSLAATRASPLAVAIELYGEELETWHDWNGAVVGSGPLRLTDAQIAQRYLRGSGWRVIDAFRPW